VEPRFCTLSKMGQRFHDTEEKSRFDSCSVHHVSAEGSDSGFLNPMQGFDSLQGHHAGVVYRFDYIWLPTRRGGFDSLYPLQSSRALTVREAALIRPHRRDAGREFSGSSPLAGLCLGRYDKQVRSCSRRRIGKVA
jgi:hypothetical protein